MLNRSRALSLRILRGTGSFIDTDGDRKKRAARRVAAIFGLTPRLAGANELTRDDAVPTGVPMANW